ncbi:hypothetical protein NDU88_005431 [Pleurodeles waltl]|uniref:Uncharacterized protein n=1 Tax=Pleurodeles waltl TaxID=8319 RepID=A0AAV7SLQ3_PLEWA|nr:hypothetical protein NDU88_005431 [Pleurodeles waltl]
MPLAHLPSGCKECHQSTGDSKIAARLTRTTQKEIGLVDVEIGGRRTLQKSSQNKWRAGTQVEIGGDSANNKYGEAVVLEEKVETLREASTAPDAMGGYTSNTERASSIGRRFEPQETPSTTLDLNGQEGKEDPIVNIATTVEEGHGDRQVSVLQLIHLWR